jgi:choline dehydrogenase-like flavoprotein
MVYVPPSKTVIDAWEALGNKGWGWEVMEPYFAKAFSIEKLNISTKQQLGITWSDKTTDGPIQTSFDDISPFSHAWYETLKQMDLLVDVDPFSGVGIGSFPAPRSIDPVTGERSYSATAHYATAADRQNLHILTGCLVEKIILETSDSEVVATGVQYLQNGQSIIVKAEKEVILAAGALQSPKILELSGIGNKELLEKNGIKVIVDNPQVGENLQDHVMNRFVIADEDPGDESLLNNNPTPLEAAMITYNKQNPGPNILKGISSIAYLPLLNQLNSTGQSTLNSLFETYPTIPDPHFPLARQYYDIARTCLTTPTEASGSYLDAVFQSLAPKPKTFAAISFTLSQPLSRGNVHISSSDPTQPPIINPKYFSHPLDIEIYALHLQFLESLCSPTNTSPSPIATYISTLNTTSRKANPKNYFQGTGGIEIAKDFIRRTGISNWHPTSTCSMLPREKGGVVDNRLRVWGVKGLRIVDASVFPLTTRGNPMGTVYAVAERAAGLIGEDWRLMQE